MSSMQSSNDELWELFDAMCDGRLDDEGVERLEHYFTSAEHREEFVHYCQLHADLHFRIRAERAGRRGVAVAMAGDAAEEDLLPRLVDPNTPPPPSTGETGGPIVAFARSLARRMGNMGAMRHVAAAVALIAVVAFAYWLNHSPEILPERERQPIASLTGSDGARWQGGFEPGEGVKLMEGQLLNLVEGRAQIGMSCGADLVLKAPCSVVLTSPKQVLLQDGVLSVKVADWTDEFAVATNAVQIVDLGREFVVSVDAAAGAVEAHAIEGKLRVSATNVPEQLRRGLLVSTGEALRLHPATNSSIRLKANQRLYDPGIGDSRPFKPLAIFNTGIGLSPGDDDPNWRIVASSDEFFVTPQPAVVCEPYGYRHLANDPATSQWISVSTPIDKNCPPDTMYTFATELDLTGYDLASVTLVANVLADNGVMAVRINGESVRFKPWNKNVTNTIFNEFHCIEFTDGLVEGVNRIEFDVWNGINVPHPERNNPMAFRVEWQAFGRLKPPTGEAPIEARHVRDRRAHLGALEICNNTAIAPWP